MPQLTSNNSLEGNIEIGGYQQLNDSLPGFMPTDDYQALRRGQRRERTDQAENSGGSSSAGVKIVIWPWLIIAALTLWYVYK